MTPNCKRCDGTGEYEYEGDLHKSAGLYPCDCTMPKVPDHCVFSYKLFTWSPNEKKLLIMRRATLEQLPHEFPLMIFAIQGKYERKDFLFNVSLTNSTEFIYESADGTIAVIERVR